MKIKLLIIIGLFIGLCSPSLTAQEATGEIKLMACSEGSHISLRWMCTDYPTWLKGCKNGYSLTRYTVLRDSQALSIEAIEASKLIMAPNILPLPEADWATFPATNNFAKVARHLLYEDSIKVEMTNNPTLADAVDLAETQEGRFMFAAFAAEQDFEVATGMGLGYKDEQVDLKEVYIYQLQINGTDTATAIRMATNDIFEFPAVEGLIATGSDRVAMIEWSIEEIEVIYSSFDIERSTDSIIFEKINETPFIFTTDTEEDTQVTFKDELPDNSTSYYYRVIGRNSFGKQGPPSEAVKVKGVDPRLEMSLKIDSVACQDGQATLRWDNFDDSFESKIKGFYIYRSLSSTEDFTAANTSMLPNTARLFTDESPLLSGYYILRAIDNNDNLYESNVKLVQLPDSIPPAPPTGFSGLFLNPTRVKLTWEANVEPDLKGYRLFVGNRPNGNFTQITPQPVNQQQFVYEIAPEFLVDSIYFKIAALDFRENTSVFGTCLGMVRPDKIPPAKPVLQKVTPTPAGVQLGWRFSSSEDVVNHILQKKQLNGTEWETVLDIAKAEEINYSVDLAPEEIGATCYLDSTFFEKETYQYRLLAYDEMENQSSSSVINVIPYDNGLRGQIESFKATAKCLPNGALDDQFAFDVFDYVLTNYQQTNIINFDTLRELVIRQYIDLDEQKGLRDLDPFEAITFLEQRKQEIWQDNLVGQVALHWDYANQEELTCFDIYRSAEGSALIHYKSIPATGINTMEFLDEDIKAGKRYYYQVIAKHTAGAFSEPSKKVLVRVPRTF